MATNKFDLRLWKRLQKSFHDFRTTNARKSIKGSKDSYDSLESKKMLSH